MDKIAIISDIHGNLEALKTVLGDIKERNINKIFCLGDIIAKGTHQQECVDLVRKNCEVVIKGNCDEFFSQNIDKSMFTEKSLKRYEWVRSKLNSDANEYLKNLPYCYEFNMSGRLIRLFHAHPEKIDNMIGNINSFEKFYELFLPSQNTVSQQKADIVIYGHTHIPFMQKIYNRTIINTGSIGNSVDIFRNDKKDANEKNTTVANYLILSGNYNSKDIDNKISYEFVSIPYDIEKELSKNQDNIEFEEYKEELKHGKYRDMTKVYKDLQNKGIDIDKI